MKRERELQAKIAEEKKGFKKSQYHRCRHVKKDNKNIITLKKILKNNKINILNSFRFKF